MRALAVVVVVANHLFDWPSGGFVGVDVFFVLSGFFITGVLIQERGTTGTLSFQNFYVRRVKRILPSALLVLAVTVAGSYLLFPATRAKETLLDALYAAVFASNFRFQAVGADYFQQGQPPSPLQHYWSLSIEEQFYFVWPAALVLIFALTRGLRHSGKVRSEWVLLGVMGIVIAASFSWATFLSAVDPNSAYFSSLARVWELGVGALLAIAGPWLRRIPSSIRPVIAYVGFAGVVGSLFLIDSTVQFPAPWAALPVISTALVVASFDGEAVRGMHLLTNPVARWFGDTSYTLYLWHWPVIVLLLSVLPKGPIFYGVALFLSLGLTAVTYHFYENPIRTSDWLLAKPSEPSNPNRRFTDLSPTAWSLAGGLGSVVIVVAILAIHSNQRNTLALREITSASAQANQPQAADSTPPQEKVDPCFGAPAMLDGNCVLRNPDVALQPSIDTFASDDPRAGLPCYRNAATERGQEEGHLESCEFGYMGRDATRIAIVGDSHAATLLPALWGPILEANKWRLTTYLGTECFLAIPAGLCEKPMEKLRAELVARPYDLVLVTNWSRGRIQPAAYAQAWLPIIAAGNKIAVVVDNPTTSSEALACLTRVRFGDDRTGECGTPRADAIPLDDPLIAAAQLVPGVGVIDLTAYYCTSVWCPSVIGNVIVYLDYSKGNSHITRTFASTLAPALEAGIRQALGMPR
jgi:peptidoglycan/LPS O-acetylase OafA/YrhL